MRCGCLTDSGARQPTWSLSKGGKVWVKIGGKLLPKTGGLLWPKTSGKLSGEY
jgi:hypothetical protein